MSPHPSRLLRFALRWRRNLAALLVPSWRRRRAGRRRGFEVVRKG